jgi:hypothetical protein
VDTEDKWLMELDLPVDYDRSFVEKAVDKPLVRLAGTLEGTVEGDTGNLILTFRSARGEVALLVTDWVRLET